MAVNLLPGWSARPATLADVPAIVAVVAASDIAAFGEADITSDEVLAALTGSDVDTSVACDPAGRVVAWAVLENPSRTSRDLLDVYVHPDDGVPALGLLLDWALDRAGHRARSLGLPELTVRAGLVPGEIEYADALGEVGFAFVKRYARMRVPLPVPDGPGGLPPGAGIRRVRADEQDDLRAFHEVLEIAFADTPDYLPHTFESWLSWVRGWPTVPWDQWWVASVRGVPVGVLQSSDQGAEQREGWVKNLAVLPGYRGLGLGRALLLTAFTAYTACGYQTAGLGVDLANPTGAYRLYESVGMKPVHETDMYERTVPAAVAGT